MLSNSKNGLHFRIGFYNTFERCINLYCSCHIKKLKFCTKFAHAVQTMHSVLQKI